VFVAYIPPIGLKLSLLVRQLVLLGRIVSPCPMLLAEHVGTRQAIF
jgi:hypothetical protein